MNVTPHFQRCYHDFALYPTNLFDRHSYLPTLRAYKSRLDSEATELFVQNDASVDIPIRDWDSDGGGKPASPSHTD
jgi:hypothetical protein